MKSALPLLVVALATSVPAEEPQEAASPAQRMTGYWQVDFEAAATREFLAGVEKDEAMDEEERRKMREEMAATSFEITREAMVMYEASTASRMKITVRSEDAKSDTVVAGFQSPGDNEPKVMTIVVKGDLMTVGSEDEDAIFRSLALKRLDKAAFEKRVPEALRAADPPPAAPPAGEPGQPPVAKPVPDKPGFVFSPFNHRVIDVTGLPPGTLVADPGFPLEEKKYFRVP